MARSGGKRPRENYPNREESFVKMADLKTLTVLPLCCAVRRTSLAAGAVTALLTGGLPFVGFEPGLVMGRAARLPSPMAFLLHLVVAMLYGPLLCLAISRSRDGWTLLAALATTSALYASNVAATFALQIPRVLPELHAIFAHLVFGAVFTVLFKLAEIGATDDATPHVVR
jgi:hypothetical protein